ncbi:hypothetical protein [Flavobacterium sp.]|uniref:hypothetical protein n=1 Tax=Flavobacterium sp. TaxID=239 RepID=UPI0025BBB94F|nr:hypothetical protein [Flavobacterium sp.]
MNKTILKSLLIFIFWNSTYSQETKLSADLLTFPVSPEAARLGNYEEVPVNLFYGRLEKTIPLFNGKVGDFNLPVQLSYNYAGNKLEETPSIIGLGWQLNLGGVVSREVRGLPDEHPRGYNNAAVKEIVNGYINNSSINYHNAKKITSGYYDSEVDRYSVSVNGIHFSFKIGLDGTPAFLSKHDNKIQIVRNANNSQIIEGFILTDANANQYFFDQKEINEPFQGYSSFFDEGFPSYTSSWQLSKIRVNNGQEIAFSYDTDDFKTYSFYASVEIRSRVPSVADVYNQGCTNDIIKRKILKSITCPNFNINFNYITLNNQEVYNQMLVKDMNNKSVYSYDFTYSYNRNLLDKIMKNNQLFYGFDYYDKDLPEFTNSIYNYPKNQDEYGFANGADNLYPIFAYGTNYNANKNPNFGYTVKGALSEIKYPTGGRTNIYYEQNSTASSYGNGEDEPNVGINLKFKSDFLPDAPSTREDIYIKTFDTDVTATLSHFIENVNYVDLSIKKISGGSTGFDTTTPYYLLVQRERIVTGSETPLISTQLNEISQHDSNCLGFNNCESNKDSGGKFRIPAGTYEFKFRTDYNRTQNVKASITLNFYDAAVAQFVQYKPTAMVGGIRVSKIVDSPLEGEPIIRNYDYTNSDGTSSATTFMHASLSDKTMSKETCCADGGQFQLPLIPNVLTVSSKSHNLSMQNNSPVGYLSIKESPIKSETIKPAKFLCRNCGGNFGSNWDNTPVYKYLPGVYGTKTTVYPKGYKQTDYFNTLVKGSDYPTIPTGNDLSIGIEKSKTVFSSNDLTTTNKTLTEEANLYLDTDNTNYTPVDVTTNPNYPKSLKMAYKVKLIDGSQPVLPFTLNDFFYFKVYKEFDVERFINNKKTTEYYNNKPVEKNMTIEYNSHFKQKKITTSFNANTIHTNELFYPYDFTDVVSLDMVNKNSISPLVKIINKTNGEITDQYKYDFTSVSDNFKPQFLYKSKGNQSLEKRMYYSYDEFGNIVYTGAVSSDNAIPRLTTTESNIRIIWGYNKTLIVAKIENAANINIPANLITAIETASSGTGNEASLLSALASLRNDSSVANTLVTTYTHIPLVGISTITDPKGDKITYTYDSLGRLKFVKDKNDKVLSENQYNYKQ